MEIGERIKKRREELGMSQSELAEKVGYTSRSSIAKVETNANGMTQSKIVKFASALETTPSYLMGWEDDEGNSSLADNDDYEKYGLKTIQLKKFRVLGEIACGQPIYANEEYETYIEASCDIKADFCLIARGDSMINARIFDGDVVFIRNQPDVENGEIAAVIIDDEATLKRVFKHENRVELRPENPMHKSLNYEGEELNHIRILGKAVAFQSCIR